MNLRIILISFLLIASAQESHVHALPKACGSCTIEFADGPDGNDAFQKCTTPDGKVRYFTTSGPFEHGCDPSQAIPIEEPEGMEL